MAREDGGLPWKEATNSFRAALPLRGDPTGMSLWLSTQLIDGTWASSIRGPEESPAWPFNP